MITKKLALVYTSILNDLDDVDRATARVWALDLDDAVLEITEGAIALLLIDTTALSHLIVWPIVGTAHEMGAVKTDLWQLCLWFCRLILLARWLAHH